MRLVDKEAPTAPDAEELDLLLSSSHPTCTHAQSKDIICQECLQRVEEDVTNSEARALMQSIRDAGPLGLPMTYIMVGSSF